MPGAGVEPARAEAHGILSPARLPVPPSRPGADSVQAVVQRPAHCPGNILTPIFRPTPESESSGSSREGAFSTTDPFGGFRRGSRSRCVVVLIALLGSVVMGCTSSGSARTGVCASIDRRGTDALARICSSGTISIATNPRHGPQSWFDAKNDMWKGFDVDVADEIAARLGVTTHIEQISPGTADSPIGASDPYNIAVASMNITRRSRRANLFTPAYYYTPASIAVFKDNTSIQDLSTDLDGKRICVGSGTPYESYLDGTLTLPGAPKFEYVVDDPTVIRFPTDADALDALVLGDGVRCDAVMTALPTIERFSEDGHPIKIVGDPLFYEPLAIAFEKNDPIDNESLFASVSGIVQDMHADGTLSALSVKWYGVDLTTTQPGP